MKAWLLKNISDLSREMNPLSLEDIPVPQPNENEILIKISCCGVCHTELDEIEGRTPPPVYPVVPGHQVIGYVEETGKNTSYIKKGDRVGVAWIYNACGECEFCKDGNENLCADFKATGRDVNGGYAEYITVPEKFAYKIPEIFLDSEAAPLLCAGAIGYRSIKLSGIVNGQRLGLMGFGASAHLVLKMVTHKFPGTKVYVFARSVEEQKFALELGAAWAGNTDAHPPEKLHALIDTTPAWQPVIESLKNLRPNGRLVINAIRKEEIDKNNLLNLDYAEHLWMEKEIKSVANVSSRDVKEFLTLAAEIPLKPIVEGYPFEAANRALVDLKQKHIRGAKVLVVR